ncbi:MAG: AAA family ATPase [Candidatus Limnocylindrales bacterium]
MDRSSVGLETPAFDVDLWRFEEALAVARGHRHPGDDLCGNCLGALRAAAALDRREFMAGFALCDSEEFDEWGRDSEFATLMASVAGVGPARRLLVIDGEPGIGKTRLATAVAEAARARGGEVLEDRRFNRHHYDAERMAAAYARQLREEVNLDAVLGDLVEAVA